MSRFAPVAALFHTDAYKLGHIRQYELAGNTTMVYSNFTNRKSRIPGIDHVVHFGLQAFLQRFAIDAFIPFFAADEDLVADLYVERINSVLGPNNIGSDHIRALHRKGYLPLEFKAVPEGTLVPIGVPSFTIENTEPEFFWLTNYIETVVSAEVWQASTSATIAHNFRNILIEGCERTGGDIGFVDWQGHDFSYRGMSSSETAAMSGAGHLLSFYGTDSLVSLEWIDDYYGGPYTAGSVPATEHSVMCTGIATVGERELFRRLLNANPVGIISVVSDTFDLWKVVTDYLPSLKDEVMARDGKIVVRPDSGNPVDILTGTLTEFEAAQLRGKTELTNPEKGVVELLWDAFGGTINEKGFKQLDSHVGVIYGDSITAERARAIIDRLAEKGFASTNVVFGIGSFTYQYNTRDTFSSAIKATLAVVDDEEHNLFKNPVTDDGTKKSATGRLAVLRDEDGKLYLQQKATPEQEAASVLQTVWKDGAFVRKQTFAEVREVLAAA
jgi:nicotinamide phosphoribosyltransferase